jgi:hypothetical protein
MNALQTAGFDVDSMFRNVRAGSCDASSAIWYMLLEKLGREEEEVKIPKTGYGSTRNSVNRLSYRLSSPLGSVMSMPKGRDSAAELRRLALTSSAQNGGKHQSLHESHIISTPVETCEMATQTSPSLDLPVRPTPVEVSTIMETSRYDKPLPSPGTNSFKRVVNSPSFDKKYTSSISSRTTTSNNSNGGGGWLSSVKSLFVRREVSEPNLKSFLHERQQAHAWPRDLPELPDGFIAQHHQRSQTQPLMMSDKRIVQSPPIYRSTSFGSRQRSLQLVTPPISEVDQMNYAQVSPAKPSPNRNIRNLSISLSDPSHGGNFNMARPAVQQQQQLPMPPQTPPRAALSADRADPEFAKRPIPSRLQTTPTAISSSMQLKRPSPLSPPPKPSNADKYDSCESNSSQGTTMESPLMEYSSPSSSTVDSDLSDSSLSEDEQVLPVRANKMNASKPIQIVPEPSYSAPLPPKSSFAMRWQSPQASSPFDLGAARSRLSAQNLSDSDIRNRMGRKVIVEEEEEEEE